MTFQKVKASFRVKFVMKGYQKVTTNCSVSNHSQCGGGGGLCKCSCHTKGENVEHESM